MSGLQDIFEGKSRWWAVARSLLLFAGGLVAVVGFVATTASLVAGFGFGKSSAIRMSALLGGGLWFGAFFALFARKTTAERSHMLAMVGVVFAVVGLTLFWMGLPAGWTGRLGGLPPVATGIYGAGLLAVFTAAVTGDSADESRSLLTDSGTRSTQAGVLGGVGFLMPVEGSDRPDSTDQPDPTDRPDPTERTNQTKQDDPLATSGVEDDDETSQ